MRCFAQLSNFFLFYFVYKIKSVIFVISLKQNHFMEGKSNVQLVSNEQKVNHLVDSVVTSSIFTSLSLSDQNEFMRNLKNRVMEHRINQKTFLVNQVSELEDSLKTF